MFDELDMATRVLVVGSVWSPRRSDADARPPDHRIDPLLLRFRPMSDQFSRRDWMKAVSTIRTVARTPAGIA